MKRDLCVNAKQYPLEPVKTGTNSVKGETVEKSTKALKIIEC